MRAGLALLCVLTAVAHAKIVPLGSITVDGERILGAAQASLDAVELSTLSVWITPSAVHAVRGNYSRGKLDLYLSAKIPTVSFGFLLNLCLFRTLRITEPHAFALVAHCTAISASDRYLPVVSGDAAAVEVRVRARGDASAVRLALNSSFALACCKLFHSRCV